jgi:hypothetical protein
MMKKELNMMRRKTEKRKKRRMNIMKIHFVVFIDYQQKAKRLILYTIKT